MKTVIAVVSVLLILAILLDAFETVVLPRRVTRRVRLARGFYRITWIPFAAIARRIKSNRRREGYLGFFGPLSLIMLLMVWAVGLVAGFGVLHWSLGSRLNLSDGQGNLGSYLYFSGTTFFTLGYGDVTAAGTLARILAILEAGLGFGFLALVIGYLPVIYQAFSRREASITLLDARAGSPPSAAELLRRHSQNIADLDRLLYNWERWAAELMESHLSYPVLCYYRSQHNNQSWLAALTAVLDASALVMVGVDGTSKRQGQLTFAMARHAVVDLAQIFNTPPREVPLDRLSKDENNRLRSFLSAAGVKLAVGDEADAKLSELRRMYEPYVKSLADYLLVTLPVWAPTAEVFDNWQTSAWGRISSLVEEPPCASQEEEHF
jgi:ion channel